VYMSFLGDRPMFPATTSDRLVGEGERFAIASEPRPTMRRGAYNRWPAADGQVHDQ